MAVFQPTAIVGNGRALVALGHAAELMAFFYPRCDDAQHVREGLTGVYLDGHGFSWLFGSEWQRRQSYLDGSAAVVTELISPALGLGVSVCDVMLPDEPVLLRQWQVRSLDGKPKRLRLLHYLELTLDGCEWQQAVQVVPLLHPSPRPAVVQWRQGIWCAVGSDLPFQMWQCGKATLDASNHPKPDMMDGWLNGQVLEIGRVAFAVGWQLALPALGAMERTMAIAFGDGKRPVLRRLARALSTPFEVHLQRHRQEWRRWTHRLAPSVKTTLTSAEALRRAGADDAAALRRVVEAALWTLRLTWDKGVGAPVAAPEFDPTFEASGGYGFCWCRDAAFVAQALAQLGMAQKAVRFFAWCVRAQSPDGYFHQRYWLDGTLAPAWSEDHDSLQLDQTATVLWAMAEVLAHLAERPSPTLWTMAERALRFLESRLVACLHATGMDLWETFRGSFTYTQATFVAAFRAGSQLATVMGEGTDAARWRQLAEQTKATLLQKFWAGEKFLRGFTPDGRPDPTPDASVLGVIVPFGILDLTDVSERRIAEIAVRQVLNALARPMPDGGLAVWRFAGDHYAWGMASTPATLWLGLAAMQLWRVTRHDEWRTIAQRCLHTVAQHTTPAGLLAEMFDPFGSGYWAAGHGWSAAWLLLLVLSLADGG
ncbi:hypothetical protein HRbin17_00290 [bacterium HR17]|uniref:Uncharacterized protein n=1 Tax=Candidatus Fervidibacter japonicus TaxID=2035412 RepID=A0A2H5X9D7_9BACT|nr:hypothetical protein HRbin17_00290 [bacterium HR17]